MTAAMTGCIVEESRCGRNQVLDSDNASVCLCDKGAVLNAAGNGCDKCGANEVAHNNACECELGYLRDATGSCVQSDTSVLGEPCSDADPCTEPNPYCATVQGISFCTKPGNCTKSADCPANLTCHAEGETRFCGRVSGLGNACTMGSDCAGTAALYCESFSSKVCLMEGCVTNPGICPSGWSCCDLQRFIQTSLCIPDMALMNGQCIDGSAPLKP